MKRIFVMVCILALAAGMGFASGSGETKAKPTGKVTLKVLANVDNSADDGADWKAIVAKFEAKYPNIDVQDVTAYGEAFHQKARAMLAAKDYPHVGQIWPDARGIYWQEAGQLVDHRKYLDPAKYDFSAISPMGPNGEVWEVPLGAANYCSVLYVNTEILKKYGLKEPETYADLVAMVEPLKKEGIMVVSMDGSEGWVWNSCLMSGLIPRFTGDSAWVSKAVKGTYKFTDPDFVKALAFIQTMMNDSVLPPSTMLTDYGTALTNFLNGKAACMIDGQWRANELQDPELQKSVKMMVLPAVPQEKPAMKGSVAAAITTGLGLTKAAVDDPVILDAALKFLDEYYSPENVTRRWEKGTIVGPTTFVSMPATLSPIVREKARFAKTIVTITDVIDSYLPPAANDALNVGMQKIALGQATPEAVAAEVERLVRATKK